MKRLVFLLFFPLSAIAGKVSLELDDASLVDAAKVVYGDVLKVPYVITSQAVGMRETVTISARGLDEKQLVDQFDALLLRAGYSSERKGGVVWIDKDRGQDEEIIVYHPLHRSAQYLADVVQGVTSAKSLMSRGIENQQQPQGQGASQSKTQIPENSALSKIDRSEVDQIAFSVKRTDAAKVKKLLASLDTPSGEVILKAALYEVGTDRSEGGALNIVGKLTSGKLGVSLGQQIAGASSISIKAAGIDVILSALDQDSRFRSMSRPQVRVKNGATAKFSVGSDVPVLGAAQMDKNGNPVQSVDYKQSGVIMTVTPEIRRDVVEVNINQELSSFVQTTNGVNNSPTLNKRTLQTKLSMQAGEVVVIGGLEDDQNEQATDRLPFVGWMIGNQKKAKKSEILLFLEAQRI